jgi:hypothetical protein
MNWQRRFRYWIAALFSKRRLEREMAEEMREHLELRTERYIQSGMSPEEARHAAQRGFGGVDQLKERCRVQRGWMWLENLARDMRFAVRSLRRSPGFTFVAVVTLALGIGANTALFSVVKALLFDSPFRDPDRLMFVAEKVPEGDGAALSYPSLLEYKREQRAFASLAGFRLQSWNLTGGNEPERVDGLQASANLFATLGLQPMLGRAFNADEDRPGGAKVAVIGERLWRRRFGADPSVLGTSITLDGDPPTYSRPSATPRLGRTTGNGTRSTPWDVCLGMFRSTRPALCWTPLRPGWPKSIRRRMPVVRSASNRCATVRLATCGAPSGCCRRSRLWS